jgi:hypothetical protein
MMLLVFALGNTAAQDRQAVPDSCTGPTASVIVMALEDPFNGDAHMLIVKNDTRDPVYMLTVGHGQKSELHSSDFVVPRQILAPPGYGGTNIPMKRQ